MRLTLPIPPSVNRAYRTVNGRILLSKEGREYKDMAGWMAREQGAQPLECPVSVSVRVYRPRRRGDIDNYLKVLLDALEGLLWLNDNQIVELHAYRYDDKTDARVEVEVEHEQ